MMGDNSRGGGTFSSGRWEEQEKGQARFQNSRKPQFSEGLYAKERGSGP